MQRDNFGLDFAPQHGRILTLQTDFLLSKSEPDAPAARDVKRPAYAKRRAWAGPLAELPRQSVSALSALRACR
ncbi:MAG: hypothetical protein EBV68_13390 [Betaproteobacteria bacterium]|nr:hypothetical protein [Betaproteobacteria bacterium]